MISKKCFLFAENFRRGEQQRIMVLTSRMVLSYPSLRLFAEMMPMGVLDLRSIGSFAPRDVKKFGPVVDFLIQPEENYTDLWDTVSTHYPCSTFSIAIFSLSLSF